MATAAERDPLELQIRERPVPAHVGIIMDGNGRWAEERGLPRLEGHREGSNSVREVTRTARRVGVQALTLYAFSAQNWSRPADEVAGLMELLREYLESERAGDPRERHPPRGGGRARPAARASSASRWRRSARTPPATAGWCSPWR